MEDATATNFLLLESQVRVAANHVADYGRDMDTIEQLQTKILSNPLNSADSSLKEELIDLIKKSWQQTVVIHGELQSIQKCLAVLGVFSLEEMTTIQKKYDYISCAFIHFFNILKTNQSEFRNECKAMDLERKSSISETDFKHGNVDKKVKSGKFVKGVTSVIRRLRTEKHFPLPY